MCSECPHACCVLFNAVSNTCLHNWKNDWCNKENYRSDIIMTLAPGRKIANNSWNWCGLMLSKLFLLIWICSCTLSFHKVRLENNGWLWLFSLIWIKSCIVECLTIHKIVRQQIWKEVAALILALSSGHFWN